MLDSSALSDLLSKFETVTGMMSRLAGAAFMSVFSRQAAQGGDGLIVEFGVYKGRSAFLLDAAREPHEHLYLVDLRTHDDETLALFENSPNVTFLKLDSTKFLSEGADRADVEHKCRIVHVDGSHTFQNVWKDLEICDKILRETGIVVLDDFTNTQFPQVQAALYHYLSTTSSNLQLFLLGGNKAFLCRSKYHDEWLAYSKTLFVDDMKQAGFDIQLSKTDSSPICDVVEFRVRKPDEGPIYGPRLYAGFFE